MSGFDFDGERRINIPANIQKLTSVIVVLIIIGIAGVIIITSATVSVPAGHRGVLLTWGKVENKILGEGLNFKTPFIQTVVYMNVQIQKAESTEATATQDLQEVSTTVAVNYRLNPSKVNEIYRELRQDYVSRVIKPNIEESLKATTANFRAEELITNRAVVKATFDDILVERLSVFQIDVISVSLTDFQFSASFSEAIESKVIAEQEALQAKNTLEQIRYEAQQQIIQAEAAKNATIARALGVAEARIIEAEATAEAINVITTQMTPEYAQYLWLQQWDGKLPVVLSGDEQDYIIDISQLVDETN